MKPPVKYIGYLILLYMFLPLGFYINLVSILLFFIIFNEDKKFALLFAFFSGLLIDLYYPTTLGLYTLIYTCLAQLLLYLKRYIMPGIFITFLGFIGFYFVQNLLGYLIVGHAIRLDQFTFTIISFLPSSLLLKKTFCGVWIQS